MYLLFTYKRNNIRLKVLPSLDERKKVESELIDLYKYKKHLYQDFKPEIKNIYDYMYRLAELKAGQTVEVKVLRNNKELLLSVNL